MAASCIATRVGRLGSGEGCLRVAWACGLLGLHTGFAYKPLPDSAKAANAAATSKVAMEITKPHKLG